MSGSTVITDGWAGAPAAADSPGPRPACGHESHLMVARLPDAARLL